MYFSATRTALIDAFLHKFTTMPAGSTVTYADLSAIAGEKIGPNFYPLRRAIQVARDKHAILIRCERGVGFVRSASFDERRDMLDQRRGKVRRQALTGLKEVAAVMRGSNVSGAEMMTLTRYQGAFAVSHMNTGGSQATASKISGTLFTEPRPKPEDIPE